MNGTYLVHQILGDMAKFDSKDEPSIWIKEVPDAAPDSDGWWREVKVHADLQKKRSAAGAATSDEQYYAHLASAGTHIVAVSTQRPVPANALVDMGSRWDPPSTGRRLGFDVIQPDVHAADFALDEQDEHDVGPRM